MSSFSRNPPGHDRKPSATTGSTRQRGAQSTLETRNSIRTTKESATASVAERRTERSQVTTTRQTVAVRTARSPLKPANDNRPNARKSKDMGKPSKLVDPISMSTQTHEEEPMGIIESSPLHIQDVNAM
ncbi:hypothetical protein EJ05DRAFT_478627 [Pseudovirgaria hyperparasitica]|uniref:Uncharacterized protein n=1 Tax=Pseudovirgaria hyperparasitica TaxID=470096 RepID=A0A6A6W110_9PEZI|nr:uncharacterized protein EJ05DRAFT_478627 [Pseudovirgaria hyperparasitica]KAF2755664.1 hypothetical protein EJ05DRAFT_478627 [Pseudovirgaria hyperparasitica]